jgi:hypothetical protein
VSINDTGHVATTLASLTRTTGENVGSYNITGGTLQALSGGAAGNYSASFSVANSPTLTISAAALTATIGPQNKTYGTNNPTVTAITPTLSGVVNTTVTNWNGLSTPINDTGNVTGNLASLTRNAGENVGSYNITGGTLTLSGPSASNYSSSFSIGGSPTINPAALTVSANNASKTYGQTLTFTGFTSNGLQYGETVGSVTLVTTGADATANAGSYAITASGATGGTFNPTNYAINYANGTLTINPQALTITANDVTQTYNSIPYSGGNGVTYSGFVNGQNSSVLSGTIIFGGNSQGAVNAGTYTIIPSGQSSSNYAITYVNGTLTINPAAVTVAINPPAITQPPITVVLDSLAATANIAGMTSPSTVMNATVLPTVSALPGNPIFGGNTAVLPYGNDVGAVDGSANQQTSNTSTTNQQTSSTSNTNQQTATASTTNRQASNTTVRKRRRGPDNGGNGAPRTVQKPPLKRAPSVQGAL